MSLHYQDNILNVHSVESFGTHDGPGIRMVVFLQGCKLKCQYCHNPDTIDTHGGEEYHIEDLVQMALKVKPYFGKKGGVTVSGGEPLLQSKALIPFFKRLKEEGIHTNIDTNGRILNHFTEELLDSYADLVMLDIKHMTEEGFETLTGAKNKETTFNFAKHREASGKPMWLRYVLIPGITNKPELLQALGEYFQNYETIEKIELQPYHKLGIHKWEALGWEYPLMDARENTEEEINDAVQVLQNYFKEVKVN
ncbi:MULTISPECIES: pyruvate formate-lyase-activating protein [Aestuariibaculum]|uniref:Pyruvate formate-lyase-activating enzyme n=1 Tax=Aestuariibaculum lutulentum TaxID=2920935 RepID=A0ABS9RJZ2_9FLAO|nr:MULTISPECIES: pyruvate formate-lyase-activating protein [Aestuariibaculum]MCH4552439.1 pyruvate formate-lyase-activating protein [Aestuariibaculum lutulentum]MCR8668555.1 pyruvate formate-lyase-activating protein [Aestuariibaculum sp. M13]